MVKTEVSVFLAWHNETIWEFIIRKLEMALHATDKERSMNEINSLFDVSGKVALITGATGGFGAAVSKGLARAGVKIMATGRSEEKLAFLAGHEKWRGFGRLDRI